MNDSAAGKEQQVIRISSSYEASYLVAKGHHCRLIPKDRPSRPASVGHQFRASKQLDIHRQNYREDIDIQEFIQAHSRLVNEARYLANQQSDKSRTTM